MAPDLANAGVVIHNWPDESRHPGLGTSEQNKGIASLSAKEQVAVFKSFVDEKYPLFFEKFEDPKSTQGRSDTICTPSTSDGNRHQPF